MHLCGEVKNSRDKVLSHIIEAQIQIKKPIVKLPSAYKFILALNLQSSVPTVLLINAPNRSFQTNNFTDRFADLR